MAILLKWLSPCPAVPIAGRRPYPNPRSARKPAYQHPEYSLALCATALGGRDRLARTAPCAVGLPGRRAKGLPAFAAGKRKRSAVTGTAEARAKENQL